MNQRKKTKKNLNLRFSDLLTVAVAVLLLAVGGVYHAVVKNQQIRVSRDIVSAQTMINEHNEARKYVEIKIENRLNRHVLRNELREQGTDLCMIPVHAVEIVEPLEQDSSAIADNKSFSGLR